MMFGGELFVSPEGGNHGLTGSLPYMIKEMSFIPSPV
jgi:hypothetical protein